MSEIAESTGALDDLVVSEHHDAPVVDVDIAEHNERVSILPRISIHAFCHSPDTGVVLQRAADDRRAARAHMTVMMDGVDGAIRHYSDKSTPNLILVEMSGDRSDVLAGLEKLAEHCDPGTKVIVIGAVNDIELYRELIRSGVSEYLVPPLKPVQLIDTISILYGDPQAAPVGRVMSFIGAKGGVGASTVAHNVGWSIASDYEEGTTILDFDMPFGTTGLDFNQDSGHGLVDAVTSPDRLDEVLLERLLTKCTDHLNLLTAPPTLDRDHELSPETCDAVIDVLRTSVPRVVVDLPHTWTAWSRQVLLLSDDVVIVATPDLASLRNTKNLMDYLKQGRPNDAPPRLVLNQVGVPRRPEIPLKEFSDAVGVEPCLVLPFDGPLFASAANNGQMLPELKGDNKPATGLRHLAAQLTGREETKKKRRKGGWSIFGKGK